MSGLDITDQNFDTEVVKATLPVLVDFWADWCGPCKMLGPLIDELATQYTGKIKVCKLNVDNNQVSAQKYGILSIPTVILFKGGQPVGQLVGVQPKEKFEEEIKKVLGS